MGVVEQKHETKNNNAKREQSNEVHKIITTFIGDICFHPVGVDANSFNSVIGFVVFTGGSVVILSGPGTAAGPCFGRGRFKPEDYSKLAWPRRGLGLVQHTGHGWALRLWGFAAKSRNRPGPA